MRNAINSPGLCPGAFRQLPHPSGPAMTPGLTLPGAQARAAGPGRGPGLVAAAPLPPGQGGHSRPPSRSPSQRGRGTAPFPAEPLSTWQGRDGPWAPLPPPGPGRVAHRPGGVPHSPGGGGGAPCPGGAAGPPGAMTCPPSPAPC